MNQMKAFCANCAPRLALLMALILAGAAQAQVKDNMSPEETVKTAARALHDGRLEVIWNLLPPSYQKDVTELVVEFGNNMDLILWAKGADTLQKYAAMVKAKESIVIELFLESQPTAKKADIQRQYKGVVSILDGIAKSRLLKLVFLKEPNVRTLLTEDISPIYEKGASLFEELAPKIEPEQAAQFRLARAMFKDVSVKDVKVDGESASLKLRLLEQEETLNLVKIEGHWVPKELASGWANNVAKLKTQFQGMKVQLAQSQISIMALLVGVDSAVNSVMAINTKEEMRPVFTDFIKGFRRTMIRARMVEESPGKTRDG